MIILDIHVLIWLDARLPQLGSETAGLIDTEFVSDGVAVSAISFWETAILTANGRLVIAKPLLRWREDMLLAGMREVPVDGRLGIEAADLRDFHGDPADRLIVATALTVGCPLVTADRKILDWSGPLNTLDARH